jgi:hypothetical protein
MSDEIFKWMPQLLDYQESNTFRTLVSTFENGMEQRRSVYTKPIGRWVFRYEMVHLSKTGFIKVLDSIALFHVARKGSYDNFWIPSWRLESTLFQTSSGVTIVLNQDALQCGFVATPYSQGNFIYITDNYTLHTEDNFNGEVKRLTEINGNTITLDSALTNTYQAGAYVMKAFKVRFEEDSFEKSYLNPYAYQSDVAFKEDIAGYQEVVLP